MPGSLEFVLLDRSGQELLTSEDTPIKISSFNSSGRRFYLSDLSEYPDGKTKLVKISIPTASYPYHFYYSTLGMPLASSNGSKEWYLELNGRTDTLHYDVRRTRPDAAFNQYDVVSISFNGRSVVTHYDSGSPYYILQRRN